MADGKDGLWGENVGPSLYAHAQGKPIRIWGFLGNGQLHYHVLPADGDRTTNMNGERYEWLVKNRFAIWRKSCFGDDGPIYIVQDHERCLWQARNLSALRGAGCTLVANFPKSSPDLNAIEGWWRVLRERLVATAPVELEGRASFIARLRRTVTWLNENRSDDAFALCTNQKARAEDVRPSGAKTKW